MTEFYVGNSLCNWHDEQYQEEINSLSMDFTDDINIISNSVGINNTSSYFLALFLKKFIVINSLNIYRGNIFIDKIYCNLPTKIFY